MPMQTYRGQCHCGAVRFTVECEPIVAGCRCNCSICVRKGAVMSVRYFTPDELTGLSGLETIGLYRWGDHLVNHYFCRTCGIYPFHDSPLKPGHYRVNLGCLDGVDPLALPISVLDGRSL
jgi:hypothetical protein